MNISIIGGGNIGTQFAVHCSSKGYKTTIYTSRPQMFSRELSIVDEKDEIFLRGNVEVTDSLRDAVQDADLIFVTIPAQVMEAVIREMIPYITEVDRSVYVGLIPGTGGGEALFNSYISDKMVVFGIQRVPSVARLVTYGKTVKATGYRNELHLSSIPGRHCSYLCDLMSSIFDMRCVALPNYLNITLTPSNPVLHTTRLYSLFKDYRRGMNYDNIPLFYEEWSDESSELLFLCDEEVQNICSALKPLDLSFVKSLREHYGSQTSRQLTSKLRSIKSLQGIKTPQVEIEGKYAPDLNSRYFTADFPYGLEILVQIATFANVDVPNCRKVLDWYYLMSNDNKRFSYKQHGVNCLMDLIAFYSKE